MLTPAGLERVWEIVAGTSDDTLDGGVIRVGNGTATAEAAITQRSVAVVDGMARLTVVAEFAEESANFDWSFREVVTKRGQVLDRTEEDQGRKVAGQVWTAEQELDLGQA